VDENMKMLELLKAGSSFKRKDGGLYRRIYEHYYCGDETHPEKSGDFASASLF
jgi:hypothetical protein